MKCSYCGGPALARCPRCRRALCPGHGDDVSGSPEDRRFSGVPLCPRCRDPGQHLPSPRLFRGSLLALLVAGGLGLWLLLWPAGGSAPPLALESPAPTVAAPPIPGPPGPAALPGIPSPPGPAALPGMPSPSPTPTPQPLITPTPAATPSPTPAPAGRYVVEPGDNPSVIAQQCNIALDELLRLNPGLNPTGLQPGQELVVPPGARC